MMDALKMHSYRNLVIKRQDRDCYLLIYFDDSVKIFTDKKGKRKAYRHAWQIKDWLEKTFGINPDDVPVEKI